MNLIAVYNLGILNHTGKRLDSKIVESSDKGDRASLLGQETTRTAKCGITTN